MSQSNQHQNSGPKAILEPSGDQTGPVTSGKPVAMGRGLEPSAPMTITIPFRVKAIGRGTVSHSISKRASADAPSATVTANGFAPVTAQLESTPVSSS